MKRITLFFATILLLGSCCNEPEKQPELKLWYSTPSEVWTDALPIGNGRLGAMVYGTVEEEHVQFNEETLWTGEPTQYSRPDGHQHLGRIQQLLFEGKQKEAEDYATKHFMSVPLTQRTYQPFGDLYIEFDDHDHYSDYKRELNLRTALQKISYKVGETTFTREYLVSKPDQVLAIQLSSDKKKALDFSYRMDALHKEKATTTDGTTLSLDVSVADGICSREKRPYKSVLFGNAKVHLQTDGEVEIDGDEVEVKNATKATLYLSAATNFKNYNDVSGDPKAIVDETFAKLGDKQYDKVREEHIADYGKLFDTFALDFGQNAKASLPTNVRLSQFLDGTGDPGLIALYVQYGRYLMLSSSREGTYAANLQGIWNDLLTPPWDSKYTTNINAEMNYWIAETGNLSICHDSFFNMVEEIAKSGATTARNLYDASGWCLHHNTDIWRGTAPINASNHGIYLGGGGWVSLHLWEHYLFTKDINFLRDRGYPLMKGAAQFYYDVLIKDPKTGWLVSSPSNSPETGGLVYGPSMDHQIIRSLFKACIASAELLDCDKAFATQLREKLAQIAPDQIGKHKQLQEWVEDKDDINNKHRHVSHLWGVHPGKEINWKDTPELMKAAIQSLEYRGDDGTGWSLAWKINFWARFLDGDRAYKLISMLFRNVSTNGTSYGAGGGSYNNLFCAHPPFQIDGNYGGAAGIIEILIQSHMDEIELLPALPAALPDGRIAGVCARGGFELSFSWKAGVLEKVDILSKAGGKCKLKYKGNTHEMDTEKGKTYSLTLQDI